MTQISTPGKAALVELHGLEELLPLFNTTSKRELERLCRRAVLKRQALSDLIFAGRIGALAPYVYQAHFLQRLSDHLEPTPAQLDAVTKSNVGPLEGEAKKAVRKIFQTIVERRLFAAHLFYTRNHQHWHLIYFDQRDQDGQRNHWKYGPHMHFVNDLCVSQPLKQVWQRVVQGDTGWLKAFHLRYHDIRDSSIYGSMGSLTTQQKSPKRPTTAHR